MTSEPIHKPLFRRHEIALIIAGLALLAAPSLIVMSAGVADYPIPTKSMRADMSAKVQQIETAAKAANVSIVRKAK